ncbi:MAG TPA: ATP-binding protein [Verrucomicrobiae bacterium]
MAKERVVIGWSGGKDSALALREILRGDQYEVAVLLTTCTEGFRRISMHGVRCSLLKTQAQELRLPLRKVFIARECSNADYEARMHAALLEFKAAGISKVVFGDLFLEEIRAYRDRMLAEIGMTAIYPVWGRDTRELAEEFIALGFRATLVCVDPQKLAPSFAGRMFDRSLLRDLPATADPCGENGEFHTFVFDGPIFRNPVRIRPGPTVLRQNFYFADLLPAATNKLKGNK